MRASVAGLALAVLAIGSAHAQYMISAHSGVVQYVEGSAYLNDNQIEPRAGEFPSIKENQVFRTTEGMAEVLLTPGVFLRMGENSSIRMVSTKLDDTRVEVLKGSAMVEVDDLAKDNAVMLLYKGNEMLLVKHGLFRVDAEQGLLKVYDGEAIVKGESGQLTLHKGKETALNGVLMAENFDAKADDELYRWSDRRSGYLAKANVSSANSLIGGSSGSTFGGFSALGGGCGGAFGNGFGSGLGYGLGNGVGYGYSPWQFNPMFGMYTFVPCNGFAYSPFGYGFYSPYTVWQAPYYGGGAIGGGGGIKRPASPVKTGTGTGKHTDFVASRGSSPSYRSPSSGGSSGGGVARAGGYSSGTGSVSVGSVSAGSSAGHGGGTAGGHR
ncbi:MAG TPA: hypothetical protein VGP62_10165 [Bryobacteraceae bacterium]|jgi:hypothetical protein|nr:hypothetical protein [Bryobacteraceae bacterium]